MDEQQAVIAASTLYHETSLSIREIARHLKCSRHKAEKLIVFSCDKWEERKELAGFDYHDRIL